MSEAAITVSLRLPDKALSPNAPGQHWSKKARAIKAYRGLAHVEALAQLPHRGTYTPDCWEKATVLCKFYWPDKRRRDRDNAAASMKAAFDGIADAGIVKNDHGLTHLPVEFYCDPANPRVEITIMEANE